MNRTLLLMRHAKAEDSYEVTDYDRALTTKGWGQAERVGQLLAERGYTPDHVICSAAKRTRQTLEGVLSAMELSGGSPSGRRPTTPRPPISRERTNSWDWSTWSTLT